MNKVLMILTHNRLDCLKICLEMLDKADALTAFDVVVLLLNGVPPMHRAYVDSYIAAHSEVNWDIVIGSGIRPQGISQVQNECIKRYPDSLYVKVDEDVFVPDGWAERLFETYDRYKGRDDLALITPLIPNNAYGLHRLLTSLYPDYLEEFKTTFSEMPSDVPQGPTWQRPDIAQWATRKYLALDKANREQRVLLEEKNTERYHEFCKYFSIGCICYDYQHVLRLGGQLPERDEPQWCGWIEENQQLCVLDQSLIVLHYAFFVQQIYLDRSSLLEDIRVANLPDTIKVNSFLQYYWPRYRRIAEQMPEVVGRRLGLGT